MEGTHAHIALQDASCVFSLVGMTHRGDDSLPPGILVFVFCFLNIIITVIHFFRAVKGYIEGTIHVI